MRSPRLFLIFIPSTPKLQQLILNLIIFKVYLRLFARFLNLLRSN
jgi:hypothetical protein